MSVALEVVSVAGKAAGKKSKSSRKEERAAVDEKLKKFVCPGHEEVKKPKQKTLFKAAQTLMGSKNFGDALACAIHAGRLDPLGAYKEWNFAARLRERIPSANCAAGLETDQEWKWEGVSVCSLLGMAAACRGDSEQRLSAAKAHAACHEREGNYEAAAAALAQLVQKEAMEDGGGGGEAGLLACNLMAEMAVTGMHHPHISAKIVVLWDGGEACVNGARLEDDAEQLEGG
eukprot:3223273-Rhodomonas_salina.1